MGHKGHNIGLLLSIGLIVSLASVTLFAINHDFASAGGPTIPSAPTNLVATGFADTRVFLTWDAPYNGGSPILGYKIDQDSGSGFTTIVAQSANLTERTITGLSPSTFYTYRVSAINAIGNGTVSNTSSTTTLAPPPPTVPSDFVYLATLGETGINGTDNVHFDDPRGIAVDSLDNIYVADFGNHRVQKFNPDRTYNSTLGVTGVQGSNNTHFRNPVDLEVDSQDNLYVSDHNNQRVQKFNSTGVHLLTLGVTGVAQAGPGADNAHFFRQWGVAVDSLDNIFVVDQRNFRVQKFNSTGVYLSTLGVTGVQGSDNAHFSFPTGVAVDSLDNLYVADRENNRVQKFNSAGVYQLTLGVVGFGGPIDNAHLGEPTGIEVDSQDNLYVSGSSHRVQKFNSTTGAYQSTLGEAAVPGIDNTHFNDTDNVAFDSLGNLYVSDRNNHRVQVFSPAVTFDITLELDQTSVNWGNEVNANGTLVGDVLLTDKVLIDWDDGTPIEEVILPVTTSWGPVPHTYAIGTVGTHNVVATLHRNPNLAVSEPFLVTVLAHPTTVILDPISDPYTGDVFTVTGRLVDNSTGLGVPEKIVEFDGSGAVANLTDATTNGFTVTDTVNGITIENVTADNILRPENGTVISFPSNPTFVTLSLKNMSTNEISVLVTPGEGPTFSATGLGPGINIGLFTISHPDGISSIEVTGISGTGIAGITRIQSLNSEQVQYIDEEFTTQEDGESTSLSFAEGSFFSIGTSQATIATDLIVNATFDADDNYEASVSEVNPPTNVQTYSVLSSTAGGVGGNVAVTADTGLGRTSILCIAGNDNDGDALCNDWETTGIPYPGGSYLLTGANPNIKDVYVELDYMPARNPFVAGGSVAAPNDAIEDVMNAFNSRGISLHVDQGNELPSPAVLTVWTDADADSTNDFNSIKSVNFGTGLNDDQKTAKAQAYRYFIFANSIGGSSGIAELRGNDAVVALGTGFDGTRQQYAGTFMHELGHLLNLNHGGPKYLVTDVLQRTIADSSTNCKPIHDSIMSYSRQLPTLLGNNWILDYSDGGLSSTTGHSPNVGLTETSLKETRSGVTGGNLHSNTVPAPWIVWGTPGSAQTYKTIQASPTGASTIDWSGDGTIAPFATNVIKDVNNFGITGCGASTPTSTAYHNYNEWDNLDYNFRQGPSGQFDGEDAANNSYPLVINDYDTKTVAELEVLSSYHNALFPWKADSSLTLKKGLPIPIDIRLFDGANNPLVKGDGTVSYKLYKSGDSAVKASGSLIYDKFITKSWVTAIHPSKITSKGTWFIEITFTNTAGSHVTRDQIPSTNPIYTNPIPGDPDPLMSLKVIVT